MHCRSQRGRLTVVVLVATVALASCGSSSGSNSSAGSSALPDACTLVTATDIQSALGASPLTPPKTDSDGQCAYASATESNYVNVQVEGGQTTATFEKASSSAGPTQRITGLGDEAFQNMGGGTVFVLKGATSVRIDVFLTTVSSSAVQSLAQTAIGRL